MGHENGLEITGYSCWSCDTKLTEGELCLCEESRGLPPVTHRKPNVVMPFCSEGWALDDHESPIELKPAEAVALTEPVENIKEDRAKIKGKCCVCEEPWEADSKTLLTGTCPYCGHSGFVPPPPASSVAIDDAIKNRFLKI